MFPGRLAQLPPSSFAQLASLLDPVKPGGPVISLAVGDPRGTVPAFVTEKIAAHAHQFGEYPPTNGTAEWRQAASGWLCRRFDLPAKALDPEVQVLPLNGTREGLFLAPFIVTPERKAGGRKLGKPPHVPGQASDLQAERTRVARLGDTRRESGVGLGMVGAVHHQDRGVGGEFALALRYLKGAASQFLG